MHLVVWLKTSLPTTSTTEGEGGYLTPETRQLIETFVQKEFVQPLVERAQKQGQGEGTGRDQVLWFKNWTGLQSVRGLDHFHVLVRDVPEEVLAGWVNG